MPRSLITVAIVLLIACFICQKMDRATALCCSAADAEGGIQGNFSLAIVVEKDTSGDPIINRAGKFQVLFTNTSNKPIHLWDEWCQLGYETLSFRVEDGDGPSTLMYKQSHHGSSWKNKPPKTVAIPPGGTLSWNVTPSGIWGNREWKGAPEPNTGKQVKLTAVFEIKPTDAAMKLGVWTGVVTSDPIETFVVDAKLKTPHEYLEADCPKQALTIIKGDQTWIKRRDDYQRTPLHIAARYGFVDVVRWLLSHGANVNARAYNNFTPLLVTEHPDVVKILLENKADINANDSSGRTALEKIASSYAHCARDPDSETYAERLRTITKILLDAGAEYDIRSACYLGDVARAKVLVADKKQARDTEAMRWAATYGHSRIVKLLLEHGADPEDADYGGLTVSYFAIEHAHVLKLLFDAGADPRIRVKYEGSGRGPQGTTLLHKAAVKGAVESAKLLSAKGIDVNQRSSRGTTPLHEACSAGHAPMVDWLINNRADAETTNKHGRTPMSLAASEVRPKNEEDNARFCAVIRTLERAGVDVDIFAAIACNDIQRVSKIIEKDPSALDAKNLNGPPALHRAVTLDRKEIVKHLLDQGADPNVRSHDERGGHMDETALLQAAFWGRLDIAKMLINSGASVNLTGARGVVPLHEAARMRHAELASLLLRHGANVNAKDDSGKTPLDWAGHYGESPEMFKLLREHGGTGTQQR